VLAARFRPSEQLVSLQSSGYSFRDSPRRRGLARDRSDILRPRLRRDRAANIPMNGRPAIVRAVMLSATGRTINPLAPATKPTDSSAAEVRP